MARSSMVSLPLESLGFTLSDSGTGRGGILCWGTNQVSKQAPSTSIKDWDSKTLGYYYYILPYSPGTF